MGLLNESDKIAAAECATTWRAKREAIVARTHGPEHDCSGCADQFRQGRSLASYESSAVGFVVAVLGLGLLLVVAWAKS